MNRHNILDFPLNPTLTIVRLIFRRVIQCESKGVQSAVQRCQRYAVLYLQTCKNLCIVQGTGAGEIRQPAPQSKLRELRPRARATCFVPVMQPTLPQCTKKEEASSETSSCEMECGGRDSNSHRITPTTPSK